MQAQQYQTEIYNDLLRDQKLLLQVDFHIAVEEAKKSFWEYCRLMAPDFYKVDRPHLILLCEILQKFWENRLYKPNGEPYEKLMLNMPPRFGKSRTLILFVSWILGHDKTNRIITGSYNVPMAQEFSRFTRDIIQEQKFDPFSVVFNDIFPDVRLKHGSKSKINWSLEGQHFTYLGTGIDGTVTGKGCNLAIIDDPIKNSSEAFNTKRLKDIWSWFANTFLSRIEENGKMIINMTRWATGDLCGRLLGEWKGDGAQEIAEPDDWYVHKFEVRQVDTGEMLCPGLMSYRTYQKKRKIMDEAIFMANYHQKAMDIEGRLYSSFNTYKYIPLDENGNPAFDYVAGYIDTADEGDDYLCMVIAGIKKDLFDKDVINRYILDVYYTQDGMEVTEPETARRVLKCHSNYGFPVRLVIESNNGGRGFARNVKKHIERVNSRAVKMKWFHQSKNKWARILTGSTDVSNNVYYPEDWNIKYPKYFNAMTTTVKNNDNDHDDGPDATTGLVEITDSKKYKAKAGASL